MRNQINHFCINERLCQLYSPNLICFQEIFIPNYLAVFSEDYEVYVNVETNQKIGTALAIRKGIKIIDFAMCNHGRIIGIKLSNVQVWNVYAASGSGNKKARESFFRETLPNLMSIWKDDTKHIVQAGDHNYYGHVYRFPIFRYIIFGS